ncbi:MAG: DJ-1/PfpI family protein [Halobacteriales archaeon]
MKVVTPVADEFDDVAVGYPYLRFRDEGHDVDVAADDDVRGVDLRLEPDVDYDFEPGDYDAVLVCSDAGGSALRGCLDSGLLFFAYGDGVRTAATAGVLEDRSYAAPEVEGAGGSPTPRDVVVDAKLVTGRGDVAAFTAECLRKLRRAALKEL